MTTEEPHDLQPTLNEMHHTDPFFYWAIRLADPFLIVVLGIATLLMLVFFIDLFRMMLAEWIGSLL